MTPNNQVVEGKNWKLGEGGSKMTQKSDIIYVCFLKCTLHRLLPYKLPFLVIM